jgi:hypothetical protein
MAGNIDVNAIVTVAEPLVLEAIAFFKRKQAEGAAAPTDAEVLAHVRSRAAEILKEGTDALAEFPESDASGG